MPTPSETFEAIADPTRRAILAFLSGRDATPAGRIAQEFDLMSRAAVSNHLRVLRNAGLVVEQRRGQFRDYSLGPNRAAEVLQFLQEVYSSPLATYADGLSADDSGTQTSPLDIAG